MSYWKPGRFCIGNGGVEPGSTLPDVAVLPSAADHTCAEGTRLRLDAVNIRVEADAQAECCVDATVCFGDRRCDPDC